MTIFAIGINHKTAPLALREQIYFAADKLAFYLQDLINQDIAREAVLLSTCNRSELYCDAAELAPVLTWFCAQTQAPSNVLQAALYVYEEEAAVSHMMQVACSLDSMIVGESQILGQMKEAYSESAAAGTIGSSFHRLFQHIFALAKHIRTTTAIGACPVSIASAAIYFAKQQYTDFNAANITLIGAGDTSQLMLRYLTKQVIKPIRIVNRHIEKITWLANENEVSIHALSELPHVLATSDVVFSATGSVIPLITKKIIEEVMVIRQHQPLYLIDLAVPRDIAAEVAKVAQVHLFCIDDLQTIIADHKQGREHAADKAHEMIQAKSKMFMQERHASDDIADTIRAYRQVIEEIGHAELSKAKQQLKQGILAEKVIDNFAHAFMNKLMHVPSVQLRQAGVEGRLELLHYAKQLFAIADDDIETLKVESL